MHILFHKIYISYIYKLYSSQLEPNWNVSCSILQALLGTMGAMIGSGMVVRSLPYKEGFGAKQIAWMVHSGIIGAVIAPLTLLGGPIMIRAACYTAGVVGGKSVYITMYNHFKCLCNKVLGTSI